jgi:uncharacterized membrane protein required for colicin V production
MKFNWIDLVIALALLGSFVRGYRAGFLATLFSAIGFIGGGLAGLLFSLHLVKNWTGVWSKFGVIVIIMSVAASIGENILRRIGKFLHANILFGPFKWLNSLAGAALSIVRTLIFLFIFAHLLLVSPWNWAHYDIPKSVLYQKMQKYAPTLITDTTDRIYKTFSNITAGN